MRTGPHPMQLDGLPVRHGTRATPPYGIPSRGTSSGTQAGAFSTPSRDVGILTARLPAGRAKIECSRLQALITIVGSTQ